MSTDLSCVVSGFGPFGDVERNPSQLLVEALPESIELDGGGKLVLDSLVLPVCHEESWSALRRKLSSGADFLIMTGVAVGIERIQLERFAVNIRDYRIPDSLGHSPLGEPIVPGGPAAYISALPLPAVQRELADLGFDSGISNHAGAYVCNDLFYRALRFQRRSRRLKVAQFVHVPGLCESETETVQVDRFVKVVMALSGICAARIRC